MAGVPAEVGRRARSREGEENLEQTWRGPGPSPWELFPENAKGRKQEKPTAQLGDWAPLEPAQCLAGPWAVRAPEGGEGVALLTHPLHPRLLTRSL